MTDLITRAREFAITAHESIGQKRKYSDDPYWVHPERVAAMVADFGGTPEMVAAAWLHDTVEDTPVTIEEIEAEFGSEVMALVDDLTDVSQPEDGNRAFRKAMDRDHTAQASADAQTVKLCDLIDNTASIVEHDVKFARVYLREKKLSLEVLTKGDKRLQTLAWGKLREGAKQIGLEL
jgi:(p)ppGpp synthase/HD superfamily hydrolase